MSQELALLQSRQELMRSKTGELDIFEEALKHPQIINATNEEIKQALRYSMILVGVRANTINAMSEEEKLILIEFLKQKYSYHTIAEIKLAFTKAAAYELDLEIKDVAHYENFTCEYLGRIMSSYRKWASSQSIFLQIRINKAEMEKYEKNLPEIKYTDEEILNNGFYNWKSSYKKNPEYINPQCYEILYDNKMIHLTDEHKATVKSAAKSAVLSYKLPAKEELEYLRDADKMNLLCCKIAVANFFNECIETGVIQLNIPDETRIPDDF